jgi:hypothetical protein
MFFIVKHPRRDDFEPLSRMLQLIAAGSCRVGGFVEEIPRERGPCTISLRNRKEKWIQEHPRLRAITGEPI